MFLRAYRRTDKRVLQQVFYESVHSINDGQFQTQELNFWAPPDPDRETWASIDNFQTFVVEADKQPVGFATLSEMGAIDWLYVHPKYQNKGIATALIRQLERTARKKGLGKLHANISSNALAFFERNGFTLLSQSATTATNLPEPLYSVEKKIN
jgi:putative acetyltransferase